MKCCLTVAGSDSGGNAGVQADLRTFHDFGVHGCTVFAALTAQNPFRVSAIHEVPPDFVAAQLDAVLGVYDIAAAKTGMLSSPGTVEAVADRFAHFPAMAKVVDPVMIATSGARLVSRDAADAVMRLLVPLATVVTPNLPEAEAICGGTLSGATRAGGASRARELAMRISGEYGCATVVKGGHGAGSSAVDVFCGADGTVEEISLPWVENPVSTHGTGCSFASAIAASLALGRPLARAVRDAKEYVRDAIASSCSAGPEGCGVLGFAPRGSSGAVSRG